MPRIKLSEFRAKTIVADYLGTDYTGISFDADSDGVSKLDETVKPDARYVVKVDQGIKKRFKQGLIKLDVTGVDQIMDALSDLRKKGFNHFLIEELVPHEDHEERYLALERTDKGIVIHYSLHGGVEIESHQSDVKTAILKDSEEVRRIAEEIDLNPDTLEKIVELFDINYFSFLEINPLVISFKNPYFLDIASEVDSAAEFFVDTWSLDDIRNAKRNLTEEEINVRKLSEKSSSSLSLTVLNPNGSIFMLLSGGGISVALADEVKNLGLGHELANYGEYSGNPTEEETYIYTQNILSLLLKSTATKKVLVIGGGVANFTDVRKTFKGVIRALSEVADKLQEQNVKVFVRRGGPNQEEGLAQMKKFLENNNILGSVDGPSMVVSEVVDQAIKTIN